MASPNFVDIKRHCVLEGTLWEDLDFPASSESIEAYVHEPENWLWKRPKEICKHPRFLVDGASRFDLAQGELGDCWFVAAAAVLATRKDIFARVVPSDQMFYGDYGGIFRFNFWRMGSWQEVMVDDRLPVTIDGELRFCHNRSAPNEFWGALLEKAYAKLHGSYGAIRAGFVRDGLVDMTGGISEEFNLRDEDKLPPDLWDIMRKSYQLGSLMGAGIWGDIGSMTEEKLWNGLYRGHAYSVTGLLETRVRGWALKLLRLRNPWGEKEWTGPWSDGSDEWNSLSEEDRKQAGLKFEDDGEFWIALPDFLSNFHALDIVHMGPEAFARDTGIPTDWLWQETVHHGRWIKGVSAGGSGVLSPNTDIYYTNPQYHFSLKDPDEDDVSGECTCIISLLQKGHRRRKLDPTLRGLIMGFDVHQVRSKVTERLEANTYFGKALLKKQFRTRTIHREVSCRLQLNPGMYCVIPNTLKAHQEGEFLLRIYTYSKIDSGSLAEETNINPKPPAEEAATLGSVPSDLYLSCAGEDVVLDARDLRDLLNQLARKDFKETTTFSIEACRAFICMTDTEQSGVLDYDQTVKLWDELLIWRKIFNKYDKDKSGSIETFELRKVLRDIGYTMNDSTIGTLAVRYGGKDRTLFFEDFAVCLSRVMSLYVSFQIHSKDSPNEARLNLDQWFQTMMYL